MCSGTLIKIVKSSVKGLFAVSTTAFPPEERQTSTQNFHLNCGARANIKGQGNLGFPVNFTQANACVC